MKNKKIKGTVTLMIAGMTFQSALPVLAVEGKNYISNGQVEFMADESPTDPVDPENPDPENPVNPWDPTSPDNKPNPGTTGPLSLDYASSIDFGKNKITNKDTVYFADAQYLWNAEGTGKDETSARPNYVQVTDKRGTNAGWSLTVKQTAQFQNMDTLNKELTGAMMSFAQGTPDSVSVGVTAPTTYAFDLTPGVSAKVMDAQVNAGAGTWVNRLGTVEDTEVEGEVVKKNKAISLSVPGATPKDAVTYTAELVWTLSDVPAN